MAGAIDMHGPPALLHCCVLLALPVALAAERKACRVRKEPIFNSLLVSLLREPGLVPPGSIVDAGAHTGTETCLYATADPNRTVHAIEPLFMNARTIANELRYLPNVRVMQGGLGSRPATVHPTRGMRGKGQMFNPSLVKYTAPGGGNRSGSAFTPSTFQVYRLDDLFEEQWRGEALGFGHFDVEGMELELLEGAVKTIRRDAPVFTTELMVHADPAYSIALLNLTAALGYASYIVEEVCGLRMDSRNLLHVPRLSRSRLEASAPFTLAYSAWRLLPVNASSIAEFAYPCCAAGGACCRMPQTPQQIFKPVSCCTEAVVVEWLKGQSRTSLDGGRTRPLSPPLYKGR